MRAILAYAPAIVLLGVGILALALIPPVSHPGSAGCKPVGGCYYRAGTEANFLGVAVMLVTGVAALTYSLVVRRARRGLPPLLSSPGGTL